MSKPFAFANMEQAVPARRSEVVVLASNGTSWDLHPQRSEAKLAVRLRLKGTDDQIHFCERQAQPTSRLTPSPYTMALRFTSFTAPRAVAIMRQIDIIREGKSRAEVAAILTGQEDDLVLAIGAEEANWPSLWTDELREHAERIRIAGYELEQEQRIHTQAWMRKL